MSIKKVPPLLGAHTVKYAGILGISILNCSGGCSWKLRHHRSLQYQPSRDQGLRSQKLAVFFFYKVQE
jgi:hypothetical protein